MIVKQMLLYLVLVFTSSIFSMQNTKACLAQQLKSYVATVTPLSSMHREAMNRQIVNVIRNAKESVYVNMYSFTSVEIACALAFAKDVNKAKVEVILDRTSTSGLYNMKRFLAQLGIYAQVYSSMDKMNHHKYVIIDDKKVALGSYNYSQAAAKSNLESAVIIQSRPVASFYKRDFQYTQSEIAQQEDQIKKKSAKLAREWLKKKRMHDEQVQKWRQSRKKNSR